MDLNEIRKEIDAIDDELTALFLKRMDLVKGVAEYKKANNLPVLHKGREDDIIARLTDGKDPLVSRYITTMYATLFDVSRSYQSMKLEQADTHFGDLVKDMQVFPSSGVVACQGLEGANSHHAVNTIFENPTIKFYNHFEDVFNAVNNGECDFGVLPIENNIQGSVLSIYDLIKEHNCNIVKSAKIKIDHTLLGVPSAKISDIKEIYSHEQALAQCSNFIKSLEGVKVVPCENTAIASKLIQDTNDISKCAISAIDCAELYNLEVLKQDIQNNDSNYTRFICIQKNPQIYKNADKVSVMFTTENKPQALYNVIANFATLGINLTKIESRPIAGSDFTFIFYMDIDASLEDEKIQLLLTGLEKQLEMFKFLGNYD